MVVFSPHPRSKHTTFETVRLMREALEAEGAPADILQCITLPSLAASQEIMRRSDLVIATGGQGLVRAAYSSGTPAYGVGAGNATEFVDETADLQETARNCMLSKTSDFGSGCSADGNVLVPAARYREMLEALQDRRRVSRDVGAARGAPGGDVGRGGTPPARHRRGLAAGAREGGWIRHPVGPQVHPGRGRRHRRRQAVLQGEAHDPDGDPRLRGAASRTASTSPSSSTRSAARATRCGIASTDDAHIDYFARHMPVSRIMVRQPNSKANAGSFTNGMPMTSSMGCGTWGGNITSENVSLRHYLNTTWVSRTIAEDRPSDEELFGDFYDAALESADAAGCRAMSAIDRARAPMTGCRPEELVDEARRWWQTDIIDVRPGEIALRGYPIQELIGNVGFVDTIWLMLHGRAALAGAGGALEAALVASVDHGPQAPSIAIARMATTCGVPVNGAMASAINVLDDVHGGPGQQCMELYLEIDAEAGGR